MSQANDELLIEKVVVNIDGANGLMALDGFSYVPDLALYSCNDVVLLGRKQLRLLDFMFLFTVVLLKLFRISNNKPHIQTSTH